MTLAPRGKEDVLRRIVVEYGQLYVYIYMTDGNGKILDEEVFKDTYDSTYDWINEIVNVTPPLQGDEDDESESESED